MIQSSDHVLRILNPESSVEEYLTTDENISQIDYYDIRGVRLNKIKNENS